MSVGNIPLDCLGEIMIFNTSSRVFFNVQVLCKEVQNYLEKTNPGCSSNVSFVSKKTPVRVKKYVEKLKIYGKHARLYPEKYKANFKNVPNLKYLRVEDYESKGAPLDSAFKLCVKLERIEIINSRAEYNLVHITNLENLSVLDIDNSHIGRHVCPRIVSKEFKKLKKLVKLTLASVWLDDWKFLLGYNLLRVLRIYDCYAEKVRDVPTELVEKTPKIHTFVIDTTSGFAVLTPKLKGWKNLKRITVNKCNDFRENQLKQNLDDKIHFTFRKIRMRKGDFARPIPKVERDKF